MSSADDVFRLSVPNYAMIVIVIEQVTAAVLMGGERIHASRIGGLPDKAIQHGDVGVLDRLANDIALAGDRADDGDLSLGASERQFIATAMVHAPRFVANEDSSASMSPIDFTKPIVRGGRKVTSRCGPSRFPAPHR